MTSNINYILRFDGASRGNPGHSSYGFVVYLLSNDTPIVFHFEGDYAGKITNNQAEYRALLEGIKWCKNNGLKNIRIEGDSLLVINQVRGVWMVRDKVLKSYWDDIMSNIKDIGYVELRHIDRKYNRDADDICNNVLNSFKKN